MPMENQPSDIIEKYRQLRQAYDKDKSVDDAPTTPPTRCPTKGCSVLLPPGYKWKTCEGHRAAAAEAKKRKRNMATGRTVTPSSSPHLPPPATLPDTAASGERPSNSADRSHDEDSTHGMEDILAESATSGSDGEEEPTKKRLRVSTPCLS